MASRDPETGKFSLDNDELDVLKLRIGGWLLKRLGSALVGVIAIAGGALVLIFNGIAEDTAERGVTRGVVRELRGDLDFLHIVDERASLPVGTVVAVDAAECPPGPWEPFAKGAGRVVVAAGSGKGLAQRRWSGGDGTTGGEERVALTLAEMPSHSHPVEDPGHSHRVKWGSHGPAQGPFVFERSDGDGGRPDPETRGSKTEIVIGSRGSNAPHENMPPYIVLTLCERIVNSGDED